MATSGYYDEAEKLTTDRATFLAEKYLRKEVDETRHLIQSKQILRKYDIKETPHNIQRTSEALNRLCPVHRRRQSSPTQYEIPERYKNG